MNPYAARAFGLLGWFMAITGLALAFGVMVGVTLTEPYHWPLAAIFGVVVLYASYLFTGWLWDATEELDNREPR